MIKQIIFYILLYIYKISKIIFYIDKKFLDIIANPTILEPEILGNHNKNTGATLLLKTIVN